MYPAGAGAYGPTKAALEAHTLIMSQDLEGTGVSANVLVPGGMVNTRMIPNNRVSAGETDPAERDGKSDQVAGIGCI